MLIQKKAYAKINLYLKILNKRPDGYHNIFTVMQKISLCDDIKINVNSGSGQNINIICAVQNIPADKTNTAYKAAELFFDRAGILDIGLDIEITKRIPSQAGLGGGSSDAASVLWGLNEYFNFALPEDILMDTALKIGADVPFFAKNTNCAVCGGVGEIVKPADIDLSGFYCLIVKPVYNVSTKQAYDDWDELRPPRHAVACHPSPEGNFANIPDVRSYSPLGRGAAAAAGWSYIHNDFADLIFSRNKNMGEINNLLLESSAAAAGLSGSGSALFAVFDDINAAQKCEDMLNQRNDIEFCGIFDFLY